MLKLIWTLCHIIHHRDEKLNRIHTAHLDNYGRPYFANLLTSRICTDNRTPTMGYGWLQSPGRESNTFRLIVLAALDVGYTTHREAPCASPENSGGIAAMC